MLVVVLCLSFCIVGKLGGYDIETELGRGSMGVVYLAHDPCLQRQVALKTIHVPGGLDPAEIDSFRERFLREAQAAGGISHPGIVTIYGVDECPEEILPFIAMEYVAGPNLREILKSEGRLDPTRAFRIADALADALHTAHAAGVIHRDIKPANVLVRDSDGAVKIADFGVAHLSLDELTRSGELVGSPAYMAPEQIRCGDADARSDLFSLGVLLYEMLSGVRPFAGHDMAEIVHAVVYQDPAPITQVIDGLPGVMNAFFDRALAKSPRDRFSTGAELRQALNDVQLEYQISRTTLMTVTSTIPKSSPFIESTIVPVDKPETDRHSLRQYVAFVALFGIFLVGWIFWGDSPGPQNDSVPAGEVSAGAPEPLAQPTRASDPAAVIAEDAEYGESILTPQEVIAEVEPIAVKPTSLKAVPKKKIAPPKSKPAPAKTPAVETAVEAEAVTATQAAATGSAEDAAVAAPETPVLDPAQITVVTRSALKVGVLALYVDGEEALTLDLASGGRIFKRLYKKALNRGTRNDGGVLDVPPGPHEILVRVTRPDKDRVREASISVDLAEGESRSLEIVAGRMFGSGLVLRLE